MAAVSILHAFSMCFVLSNVEIGVTSDGKTVVCHHPSVEFPYELSQVRTITVYTVICCNHEVNADVTRLS